MMGLRLCIGLAASFGTLLWAGAAGAQDNLDQGKTPAQLYASDCAICHKSPQGLAKAGGLFGVQSFLREHYTASKEAAAAIAAYLESVDRGPAPRRTPPKRSAKGDRSGKPSAKKIEPGKPGSAKTPDKTPEAKASEPKASETKPSEIKPAEPKVAEPDAGTKPAEAAKAEKPKKPEKPE